MENFSLIISLLLNILFIILLLITYTKFKESNEELKEYRLNDKRQLTQRYTNVIWEVFHVYTNQRGKIKVEKILWY